MILYFLLLSVILPALLYLIKNHFEYDYWRKRLISASMSWKLKRDEDFIALNSFFVDTRTTMSTVAGIPTNCISRRIAETMNYCVSHGKKFRGILAVKTYRYFTKNKKMTQDQANACYAIAWFTELHQASMLIYDDIMDGSVTRRGKPCWHLYNNNGIHAINDASLIRTTATKLLKRYCSQFPGYMNIIDVWLTILHSTTFGQIMDCYTTPERNRPNFLLFTDSRYETIVKYKTSYYTFVWPIQMAMHLAGVSDPNIHKDMVEVLLKIGHLFQAQDDYIDVYGDPRITGKVGTDIEDGKCSWIAIQAYQRMDEKQKHTFHRNYGRSDPIATRLVRKIFKEVNIQDTFAAFEQQQFEQISDMIQIMEKKFDKKFEILNIALNLIYKRDK